MAAVRQRKKYETPRYPWRKDVLQAELKLVGTYGLRNKRELWKLHTMLSSYRKMARDLLAKTGEIRKRLEGELIGKLYRVGVVSKDASLDDVLGLTVEDLLERRLQTQVFRRGLANSIQQARQLITHGHISVGGRRMTCPGYLVKRDEEGTISFSSFSPLASQDHPVRKDLRKKGEVDE